PRAYRLLVLQSHYRSPMEVTDDSLSNATAAMNRLDTFARRVSEISVEPDEGDIAEFDRVMSNDLDTAGAVDLMFRKVREANSEFDAGRTQQASTAAATAMVLAAALGLELQSDSHDVPAEIAELVQKRTQARAAQDWPDADRIRDELAAAGWTVEDSADGPVPRRI
ncbi:MAG: CysS/YqeB C-terminal domain-containing protein, partial [Acidimicrobiia bacterium]